VAELLAKIMLNRPEVRERILTHRAHEKAALAAQLTLEVGLHPRVFSRKHSCKKFRFVKFFRKFFQNYLSKIFLADLLL
jgi:hypothetical protein